MINNSLVRLRQFRGYTQEELSELSGISVRTIRNLERGLILKPRRSSIDMLLAVLDPELRQELQARPGEEPSVPSSTVAEWMQLVSPGRGAWRGPRPPRTSMTGRGHEVQQLASVVTAHQVVVVTGPGGVGKSRVAQAVAESVGHWFADGVCVAEMGRIPAERHLDAESAMELAMACVEGLLDGEPKTSGRRMLLLLDNTEHLPRTTALLVDRLIAEYPELHVLVTSRRPPKLRGATLWEVPPLSVDAAVELLLDRLKTVCPLLDLSGERGQLEELCRELDRLPQLVEFAAHRLRMVALPTLLSDSRARRLLGSADHSMLPHQRSVEASVRWSLDLLEERHLSFLSRLARRPGAIAPDAGDFGPEGGGADDAESMDLLAELVDSSLLQVDRGDRYEYRLLRHVREFLAEPQARPAGAGRAMALTG